LNAKVSMRPFLMPAYYLVAPPNALPRHKVRSFREWLLAIANKAQS
jgi:hypothetical protein